MFSFNLNVYLTNDTPWRLENLLSSCNTAKSVSLYAFFYCFIGLEVGNRGFMKPKIELNMVYFSETINRIHVKYVMWPYKV